MYSWMDNEIGKIKLINNNKFINLRFFPFHTDFHLSQISLILKTCFQHEHLLCTDKNDFTVCNAHCAWTQFLIKTVNSIFILSTIKCPVKFIFGLYCFGFGFKPTISEVIFVDHLSNNWQVVIFRSLPLREVGDLGIFPSRLVILLYSEYYWLVNSYWQVWNKNCL